MHFPPLRLHLVPLALLLSLISSAPVPRMEETLDTGIIFVSVEAQGFVDMPPSNAIPLLRGKFHTAALIWLDASHLSMTEFYDQASERIKLNNPELSVQYWYQFDVDQHDTMPLDRCTDPTLCAQTIRSNIEAANLALQQHYSDPETRISGIHIDTESTGSYLEATVTAMGIVAAQFSPRLKLSFTRGIKQCASNSVSGQVFDHCLGQSYTDCTAPLYSTVQCGAIDTTRLWSKWNQLVPSDRRNGYAVPMLCAGGNCQGDLYCNGNKEPTCKLDERLDTSGIDMVISSIDTEFYPNVALWYGFGIKPGICPRCADPAPPTPPSPAPSPIVPPAPPSPPVSTPAPNPPTPPAPSPACHYEGLMIPCTTDTECAVWAATNCAVNQVSFYCKGIGACHFNTNDRDALANDLLEKNDYPSFYNHSEAPPAPP